MLYAVIGSSSNFNLIYLPKTFIFNALQPPVGSVDGERKLPMKGVESFLSQSPGLLDGRRSCDKITKTNGTRKNTVGTTKKSEETIFFIWRVHRAAVPHASVNPTSYAALAFLNAQPFQHIRIACDDSKTDRSSRSLQKQSVAIKSFCLEILRYFSVSVERVRKTLHLAYKDASAKHSG